MAREVEELEEKIKELQEELVQASKRESELNDTILAMVKKVGEIQTSCKQIIQLGG